MIKFKPDITNIPPKKISERNKVFTDIMVECIGRIIDLELTLGKEKENDELCIKEVAKAKLYKEMKDVRTLITEVPIIINDYDEKEELNASCALTTDNEIYISFNLYTALRLTMKQLFTVIAHEMGHYVLGHFDSGDNIKARQYFQDVSDIFSDIDNDSLAEKILKENYVNYRELQADLFACLLTSPTDVIAMRALMIANNHHPGVVFQELNMIRYIQEFQLDRKNRIKETHKLKLVVEFSTIKLIVKTDEFGSIIEINGE